MSGCPYSDYELEMWDSVCNPMGDACDDCTDFECEHNPNPEPGAFDPYEDYDPERDDVDWTDIDFDDEGEEDDTQTQEQVQKL